MRSLGRSGLDRGVLLVALAGSPVALRALEIGHPEALLGGALCVAAVPAAASRPIVAGVLVGLAVANKPWALVTVPVVVAVPATWAVRTALVVVRGGRGRLHEQFGVGVRVLCHPPEWLMPLTRPIILAVPVLLAASGVDAPGRRPP